MNEIQTIDEWYEEAAFAALTTYSYARYDLRVVHEQTLDEVLADFMADIKRYAEKRGDSIGVYSETVT